jgi:hypothetical protein
MCDLSITAETEIFILYNEIQRKIYEQWEVGVEKVFEDLLNPLGFQRDASGDISLFYTKKGETLLIYIDDTYIYGTHWQDSIRTEIGRTGVDQAHTIGAFIEKLQEHLGNKNNDGRAIK